MSELKEEIKGFGQSV